MTDVPDPHVHADQHVVNPPDLQGFLFTLDEDTSVLPCLEDFFPEVPIGDVPDLDLERSRRRFTQGA